MRYSVGGSVRTVKSECMHTLVPRPLSIPLYHEQLTETPGARTDEWFIQLIDDCESGNEIHTRSHARGRV
jgi:hypothetical protein